MRLLKICLVVDGKGEGSEGRGGVMFSVFAELLGCFESLYRVYDDDYFI